MTRFKRLVAVCLLLLVATPAFAIRTIKQSTAYSLTVFMADSADHLSGKTGLTLTITASKAGAAFAAITPTVTDLGSGWYKLAITTAHADTVGDLALHVTGTGADPSDLAVQVRANVLGDTLPANMAAIMGNTLTETGPAGTLAGNWVTFFNNAGSVTTSVVDYVQNAKESVDTEVLAIKAKTDQLTFTSANKVDANALAVGGTTQTARDLGASVLLSSGTGTGQVSITSGRVKADTIYIAGAIIPEAGGGGDIAFNFGRHFENDAVQQSVPLSYIADIRGYTDTEAAAIKLTTDHLATALELDGAVYRFTTNALEQGPTGGSTDSSLIKSTTVASTPSTTTFTLTGGSPDDDAYSNKAFAVITDAVTADQKAIVPIIDYVGATRLVTILFVPPFATATGDTVNIIADPSVTAESVETYAGSDLETALDVIDTNSLSAKNNSDTLIGRLTSTRAGYMDNLSVGAVATAASLTTPIANISSILTQTNKLNTTLISDGASSYLWTTGSMDNVEGSGGGTGLTAQETRDAMKLAPSAGVAGVDSIDDHLADVLDGIQNIDLGDLDLTGLAVANVHNEEPDKARTFEIGSRRDGVYKAVPVCRIQPGEKTQVWIECKRYSARNIANVTNAASNGAELDIDSAGMYGTKVSLVLDATDADDGDTFRVTADVTPAGTQKIKVLLEVEVGTD